MDDLAMPVFAPAAELLNAIDFCTALRIATIPVDAPDADMLRAFLYGPRGEERELSKEQQPQKQRRARRLRHLCLLGRARAGLVLRARAARDSVRRRASAHRHGRGDLAVDGGLDSFHWKLGRPLSFRDGGGHLVQWRLLDYVSRSEEPAGARVPTCSAGPKYAE